SGVLAVLFLVFNEGYLATGPDTDPVRHDLTAEAIRLTRLTRALMPEDGEVAGLLALMLLIEARRTARISASGELVALDEQDRGAWDVALVAEGHRLVRERLAAGVAPGRYQILAAINAVHTSARDVRDTDWSQVVALYDQLVRLDPSPIIALNRAVAVAELDPPEVALAAVGRLEDKLAGYHAYRGWSRVRIALPSIWPGLGQDLDVPVRSVHADPLPIPDHPGGMLHPHDGRQAVLPCDHRAVGHQAPHFRHQALDRDEQGRPAGVRVGGDQDVARFEIGLRHVQDDA